MRRYLTAASVLALVATSALSEITKQNIEDCEHWGGFAELAMNAHQEGRPLAQQMKLSPDPRAYDLTLEAYQTQRFGSEEMKERASASYRDQITAECLASLSNPQETVGIRPASFWAIDKG